MHCVSSFSLIYCIYKLVKKPKDSGLFSPSVFVSNISMHSKPEEYRRHSEVEGPESDLHICVNCMRALVNTSVRKGALYEVSELTCFVCMLYMHICM